MDDSSQKIKAIRAATGGGPEVTLAAWINQHQALACKGVEYRVRLSDFKEPEEGLGSALFEGRAYRATARLELAWDGGSHAIAIFIPWLDQHDRFGWGGRARVFVRQFRRAPGPHAQIEALSGVPTRRVRLRQYSTKQDIGDHPI
jgi:hypothetical protein